MKGLEQKISKDTSLQEVGAEHRGSAKGFTSIWITENNTVALPEEDGLLGQVLNPYNLNKAYLRVCRNKGSHGVDGIKKLRGLLEWQPLLHVDNSGLNSRFLKSIKTFFEKYQDTFWRTSNSPILASSITNERLKRAGYIFLSDYYKQVRV